MQASPPSTVPRSPALTPERFVRRQPLAQPVEHSLARRRSGAVAMACVALATLVQRRAHYDSVLFMAGEAVVCVGAILAAVWYYRLRPTVRQSPALPSSEQRLNVTAAVLLLIAFSSRTVGLTCLAGLIALSIVGCYAYYPEPSEVLEEMSLARVEVLSGVTSREYDNALHWIPILEEWSRKLEVGYALRHFELRPYQQMQAYLLRKKLESLEHELEHEQETQIPSSKPGELSHDREDLVILRTLISENSHRLSVAFQ